MAMTANSMMTGLQQSANIFVTRAKQKLSKSGKGGYPKEIAEDIIIGSPVQEGDGRHSITISFGAIMAAAFEFGSGLHAEFGDKSKYLIKPKNAPMLAFPKERWPQYRPPPPAPDVFVFSFVNHPGIAARPFIRPSITETKPEIVRILGDSFKASILIGIREVWNSK